jgi:hypothetical protein
MHIESYFAFPSASPIQQKHAKIPQMMGILNNGVKPTLVHKFSRMKAYNALAVHILVHGSEILTLRTKK